MTEQPEPKFTEPWHASVFAVTVALNEAGHFEWSDWAVRFGETLKRHGLDRALDGGDDYFTAWLETLECFLSFRGLAQPQEVFATKQAWRAAYLSTPHGAPVTLSAQMSIPTSE